MKNMKTIVLSALMAFGLLIAPATLTTANVSAAACTGAKDCIKQGAEVNTGTGTTEGLGKQIQTVVNVLLFVLGAIAVIMIVVGGIRYATSNGDSSAVTSAKNTILYAVIGLVVALLAYAIVDFVLGAFA